MYITVKSASKLESDLVRCGMNMNIFTHLSSYVFFGGVCMLLSVFMHVYLEPCIMASFLNKH